MVSNLRESLKVQRMIGLTFLTWLGIIPLLMLIVLGIVVLHPYLSAISMVIGGRLWYSAWKQLRTETIHDR